MQYVSNVPPGAQFKKIEAKVDANTQNCTLCLLLRLTAGLEAASETRTNYSHQGNAMIARGIL